MDDTPADVKRRVRALLMARSAAERLAMASEMSVAARRLAEAGVRAELGRSATDAEVFRALFLRFTRVSSGASVRCASSKRSRPDACAAISGRAVDPARRGRSPGSAE